MTWLWRLSPLIAVGGALLLLIAAAVVVYFAERDYRAQRVDETRVDAEILARAVAAPLAFGDADDAGNYLAAFVANPQILAAAVYDANGQLFANFRRDGSGPVPSEPPGTAPPPQPNRIAIVVPVVENDLRLGTVYLRTVVRSLFERLTRYTALFLLAGMVVVVLLVLASAQSALNRANLELRRRADELGETNARLTEQIAERERAEDALRQAQKMEAIGQLTGGVSHDFNNLLAIILGNLDRLERHLKRGAGTDTLLQAIDNAKSGAQRAATLTKSLLAFSRRQPLSPRDIDVNRLVAGMSELLRRTLGEQIAIETVVAGGLWRTLVDPNQLENAIINLAVNARDAMPGGGRLTIETANAWLDEAYAAEHSDVEPGQYVALCISDTGTGMNQDVVDHVFEPFFTTKDVGHGTGLGLSQVYGLVKQSGGHIKVYSEVGEGTTIKIYLPRLVADGPATMPTRDTGRQDRVAETPAQTVLVVEDEDGVRESSVSMMVDLGHRVLEARNGAEALGIIEAHPEITLLFTDVGLPGGMNGRRLAEQAEARIADLAVLYTTGYARNAVVHDGRLDPGVHLISKPFSYAELAQAVALVMQARTELPPGADPAPQAPAAAPPEPSGGGTAPSPQADDAQKDRTPAGTVLVVEDELLLLLDTVETLAEFGFASVEAGTAAQARTALQSEGARIDAAIVDLGLPDQTGDGLIAEIREQYPAIGVIVASGAGPAALRPSLADDSRVVSLIKPYEPADLEAALLAVTTQQPG